MRRRGIRFSDLGLDCRGRSDKQLTCRFCGFAWIKACHEFYHGYVSPLSCVCPMKQCNRLLCLLYWFKKEIPRASQLAREWPSK